MNKANLSTSLFLERFYSQTTGIEHYIESIKANIENILNIKCSLFNLSAINSVVTSSVINIGLVDFSTLEFEPNESIDKLAQHIKQTIEIFEPRLSLIQIHNQQDNNNLGSLSFYIQGMVKIKNLNQELTLKSTLNKDSQIFQLDEYR